MIRGFNAVERNQVLFCLKVAQTVSVQEVA